MEQEVEAYHGLATSTLFSFILHLITQFCLKNQKTHRIKKEKKIAQHMKKVATFDCFSVRLISCKKKEFEMF